VDDARLSEIEEELRRAGLRLQFEDAPEGVAAAVIARRDLGTGRAAAHAGADRLEAAERAYAAWKRDAAAG
jgi:hypothetical protein